MSEKREMMSGRTTGQNDMKSYTSSNGQGIFERQEQYEIPQAATRTLGKSQSVNRL